MRPAHPPIELRALVLAMVAAGPAAIVVNVAIGVLARAAGASADFSPLKPSELVIPTIFGTVVGAVSWFVIARRTERAWAVFRVAAPVVVLLSLIPDILLGIDGSEPGISAVALSALMATHVATGVILVAAFQWFMPVARQRR